MKELRESLVNEGLLGFLYVLYLLQVSDNLFLLLCNLIFEQLLLNSFFFFFLYM